MNDDYEKAASEYRTLLTKTEQESQAEFDKCVLTLSGGALGLSFVFIKDIVGTANMVREGWLLAAWIGWGLSSTSVLLSFYFSQQALRKTIYQLDAGELPNERAGGWCDRVTAALNLLGMILFLAGLASMMTFLSFNLRTP